MHFYDLVIDQCLVLHSSKGEILLRSQILNELGISSHGLLDCHRTIEQEKEYDMSCKKIDELDSISSREDADFTKRHNMVQVICQVLLCSKVVS